MGKIIEQPIEKDLKESYLDYAMSVIVGRALPDVRDGLKPVHRRIIYAMGEMGNTHDKPYKKSARVVGEVLGKYHPHGDTAIYDSLVRMAQEFSLRYPLIDGQGNFGSIDGDGPAAMRYTEVRMKKIAEEMLKDIDKETVEFMPNFDGTLKEPVVLPSRIPNLIINGSSGIAVGMATNIPPHNIKEIIDALIEIINGGEEERILDLVKGPDFPTGGQIIGKAGILQAYKKGRGIIKIRGKVEIVDGKHPKLIIREIPYQTTKSGIIEGIAQGVKNKKIEGISKIKDLSDKKGIEVVIELKHGANPEVVLNQIYTHTDLETTFGIINLVLVGKQPKELSLYDILNEFIKFRKEIVTRRSKYELKKAEDRVHILEGLKIALENIDRVVSFIKGTKDVKEARTGLMKMFNLSEKQAQAILDMKLQRLVGLEREKIEKEREELLKKISELKEILSKDSKLMEVIKEELLEIKEKYGDERRTEIIEGEDEIEIEDLIPNEEVAIMITEKGYVKRIPIEEYRTQRRGGKGMIGAEVGEGDFIKDIIITRTHNYILFFTDKGRVYWLKGYKVPEGGRYAKGRSILNLLELKDNEKVSSWTSVKEFKGYLVFVTKDGYIVRISLDKFSKPRRTGINAITLKEGDLLVDVIKTSGEDEVFLATEKGYAIRFKEGEARATGRGSQGVIGIRLRENDRVVSAAVCRKPAILTITENGYGKRTLISEYRLQSRGGYGVINIKTEGRNGKVVEAKSVADGDEAVILSTKGQVIRIPVDNVSLIGRATQGVRIMKLKEGEKVKAFAVIGKEKIEEKKETKLV